MSIEFRALDEQTATGGVREILHALVEDCALALDPVYTQGRAEVREVPTRRRLLWL